MTASSDSSLASAGSLFCSISSFVNSAAFETSWIVCRRAAISAVGSPAGARRRSTSAAVRWNAAEYVGSRLRNSPRAIACNRRPPSGPSPSNAAAISCRSRSVFTRLYSPCSRRASAAGLATPASEIATAGRAKRTDTASITAGNVAAQRANLSMVGAGVNNERGLSPPRGLPPFVGRKPGTVPVRGDARDFVSCQAFNGYCE